MTAESQDTEETLARLAGIFHVSDSILSRWRKAGIDVQDAREVVKKIWGARTSAPEWQATLDGMQGGLDSNSERYWRREKLRLESEKLELHNGLTKGEQYRAEDVDAATLALGSAFKLALMEAQSVLPPQLVGLNEAEIETLLAGVFRKTLSDLADLQSGLWQGILARYRSAEVEPPETAPKSRRKTK